MEARRQNPLSVLAIPRCARLFALMLSATSLYACGGDQRRSRSTTSSTTQQSPALILEKSYSHRIPEDYAVAGGTLLGDGGVLVWARNVTFLLRFGLGHHVDTVFTQDSISLVFASLSFDDRTIRVIDSRTSSVLAFDAKGGRVECSIPVSNIWNATRAANGQWYVSGFDSAGHPKLAISESSRCEHWNTRSLGPGMIGALSASALGVSLAYREPRRGVESLDSLGRVIRIVKPDSGELSTMGLDGDSSAMWVAQESIDLGRSTLQVFADLKTERRKLVVRDSLGHVLRTTEIAAMWSLLNGIAPKNQLAAFHVAHGTEILLYK